jgi:putative transposase
MIRAQEAGGRSLAGQRHSEGSRSGKLVGPSRRRQVVSHICDILRISERRACRVLGQPRATQRRAPRASSEEEALSRRIVELATRYGRYGYRRITALLRRESWRLNHKRVERLWRREGLKVPKKQPRRGRLWLNDGSCVRLRPDHRDHVWSCDFLLARTADGRAFRILTILHGSQGRILRHRYMRRLVRDEEGGGSNPCSPTCRRPRTSLVPVIFSVPIA